MSNNSLPVSAENAQHDLWCLVEGDSSPFVVTAPTDMYVARLKELVYDRGKNRILQAVDAKDLTLSKLNDLVLVKPADKLAKRVEGRSHLKMEPGDTVSSYWPSDAGIGRLHIIVLLPPATSRKRPRASSTENDDRKDDEIENEKTKGDGQALHIESTLQGAFAPFLAYIQMLAEGKLDAYLDSVNPQDKIPVPGVVLSSDTHPLIYELGQHADMVWINKVFTSDNIHLVSNSGSGKTRLALDGLCHHWGFYISWKSDRVTSGSHDLRTATEILLPELGNRSWDYLMTGGNRGAADRVFARLLLARVFVFEQFLLSLPPQETVFNARRRWVLLQILPPSTPGGHDIFTTILLAPHHHDRYEMRGLSDVIFARCRDHMNSFPHESKSNPQIFTVIDDTQHIANTCVGMFDSGRGTETRPLLHPLYWFLNRTHWFHGFVFAGESSSSRAVVQEWGGSAKRSTVRQAHDEVISDMPQFGG